MIPVRKGSQRLAKKNYLKIGGYRVFEIAIIKALKSGCFDKVVLNTDDSKLEKVALKFGIDFHLRGPVLASSDATTDMVVLDFFNNYHCERVFWLNTVSPLQTMDDIKSFYDSSLDSKWNSAVSVSKNQVHACYDQDPLNFKWRNGFARTQDLKAVVCFNYAMMGWHVDMIKNLKKGYLFNKETFLQESSFWSNFLLKNKTDMELIKRLSKVAPNQGLKF